MAYEYKAMKTKVEYLITSGLSMAVILLVIGFVSWFFKGSQNVPATAQIAQTAKVAGDLLLLSMIAGLAGMAVVEWKKYVLRSRAKYHRHELLSWLGEKQLFELLGDEPNGESSKTAENHDLQNLLLRVDIPLEQLVGQIAAGAERAISKPESSQKVLEALGGASASKAVKTIAKNEIPDNELANAHAQLRQSIEQGLDKLQITLASKWRYRIRVEAAVVSGLMGLSVLFFSDANLFAKVGVLIITVVWGGFFAWLARDLAAGLQRWRS